MKSLSLIALATLALLSEPLPAKEWSRDAAVAELSQIVSNTKSSQARQEQVVAWLSKVDTSKIDLEEYVFVKAVAYYLIRDIASARDVMIKYARKHSQAPSTEFDKYVSAILFSTTSGAVTKQDFRTVKVTLPLTMQLATDKKVVIERLGRSLVRTNSSDSHKILNDLLLRLLSEPTLTAAAKQQVLRGIYGGSTSSAQFKPFDSVDMEGKPISVKDYQGKVVLIDFWATWCRPCIREVPHLVRTYEKYNKHGFEIIGISIDRPGDEKRVRDFTRRMEMEWPQIYNDAKRIQRMNRVTSIPATFLLDTEGNIRYTRLRGGNIERRVKELMGDAGLLPVDGNEQASATQ